MSETVPEKEEELSSSEVEERLKKYLCDAEAAIHVLDQMSMRHPKIFQKLAEKSKFWPVVRSVKWLNKGILLDSWEIELGGQLRNSKGIIIDDFRTYLELAMYTLDGMRERLIKGQDGKFDIPNFGEKTIDLLKRHSGFSKSTVNLSASILTEHFLNSGPMGQLSEGSSTANGRMKFPPCKKHQAIRYPCTIHEHSKANIEAKREERIAAKLKRLAKKYPLGELSGPVESTQYNHQREAILSTPITEGDIRSGMKKTIKARLLTILK